MPDFKNCYPLWHKSLKIIPFGISVGLGLLIAGICCLCLQHTFETQEKKCNGTTTNYTYEYINSTDYWNCEDSGGKLCMNLTEPCSCNVELTVSKFVEGDVVLAYNLDMDTFFDKKDKNGLLSSRDDSQLSGNLTTTVSPSCASPYDYFDGKPIAPCGALADAMFNDTLSALYKDEGDTTPVVPSMSYGLLRDDEKVGFKNPPGDLQTVFQNFTKPISWRKPIWELDLENPKNNGFENEPFIIWMRYSELPIRPLWRLNRTANESYAKGLPAGTYFINMYYQYPHRLYPGPRNITLYREVIIEDPICDVITHANQKAIGFDVGVAGVVIGVILLVISAALVLAYKVKAVKDHKRTNPMNDSNPQKSNNTSPPSLKPDPEAIETSIKESGDSDEKLLSKPAVISEEIEPEQKPLKDIKEEEEYL